MEQKRLTDRQKTNSLRYSLPAYIMLLLYVLISTVKYIEGFPVSLSSLTLYGFVILGAAATFFSGKVRMNYHGIMMVAFFCVCLFSCLYSKDMNVSWAHCLELLKLVLFAVVFCNIVDSQKRVEGVLFFCSLATIILFFYLDANDMLETEERLGNELTGNANAFASLFMIGAFGSVYLTFCRKHRFWLEKVLFTAAFAVQLYAIALSGGRKFFVLPLLLYCGVLMLSADKKGKRHPIRNGLIAISVLAVVFWAVFEVEELYDTIGHRMEGLLNSFTGEGKVDASTAGRNHLARLAVQLWTEAPVFGHGIDTFKVLNGFMSVYSHRNYVELLSCVGIVGFVVYYSFHAIALQKLIFVKSRDTRKWYWMFVLLCMLFFDYGAVSYYSYPAQWILMLAAAELVLIKENKAPDTGMEEKI